jgi:hypothetical protein
VTITKFGFDGGKLGITPSNALAQESGIETPTQEQLAQLDRKRPEKGSKEDWTHPHDPHARITKLKDGRTHLAHKVAHAVDTETGAIVPITCTVRMAEAPLKPVSTYSAKTSQPSLATYGRSP